LRRYFDHKVLGSGFSEKKNPEWLSSLISFLREYIGLFTARQYSLNQNSRSESKDQEEIKFPALIA